MDIEIERAINLVEELGRITENNQSADDLDAVSQTLSKLLLDKKQKESMIYMLFLALALPALAGLALVVWLTN